MMAPFSKTMRISERIVNDVVVLDIGGRMTLEAEGAQLSGLVRQRVAWGIRSLWWI